MNNHTTITKTTPSPSPGPGLTSGASPAQTTTTAGATSGTKRKRTPAVKYYAVKEGFRPGIYYNWSDCLAQVTGFKGAVFQSFPSLEEATSFLTGQKVASHNGTASTNNENGTRFYGVQRGRVPGVYSNWAEAQEQIKGYTRPRYKKFDTRQEAEEFVKMGQENEVSKSSQIPGGLTNANPTDAVNGDAEIPAAFAPLPPGAEDGFDPNVLLEPSTGKIVYKAPEQKLATKAKPTGPPGMLRIYTDGSSLGNGKKIAQAGVGVYFGPNDTRNVSEPLKGHRQTNQRAELTAIIRALEIAPRHRPVTIVTDSRYAIDCVTNWFRKWVRNNWQTSDGKPVENKDLIQSILVKISERDSLKVTTTFEWVKGHNRDAGNEAADRLAVDGARRGVGGQLSSAPVGLKAAVDDDLPDELADEFDDF
ncbi:ribonuclease H, putative [Talaromyces stipitatus ATCC 10500]|uniref:ribonuclease H n=1 Tax=Talaromyces stipitatus (strain ATCC 10500 / CBS 375.48 / QM 6759 / NRRL 1006) TaxID=441959 RepID=B8ML91_TALSN|nr:ribonuclease H, putative [Talaromyces stipitatus ATCC 10500]EED15006.1 ribonuclease H, putative [Talaromyces stipitatus ATCC 10500]